MVYLGRPLHEHLRLQLLSEHLLFYLHSVLEPIVADAPPRAEKQAHLSTTQVVSGVCSYPVLPRLEPPVNIPVCPSNFKQTALVLLREKSIHSLLLLVFDLFQQRHLTFFVFDGTLRFTNFLLRPTSIALIVALVVLHVVEAHFSILFDQFVLKVLKQLIVAHFECRDRSSIVRQRDDRADNSHLSDFGVH